MISWLAVWTITITLFTAYYWSPLEDLILAAVLFALVSLIGHPTLSFVIHWLGGVEGEIGSNLSSNMPHRLTHLAPLTVNPVSAAAEVFLLKCI